MNASANTAVHSGFETQDETSPEVQNRGISRLTNGTCVLQKIYKQKKTYVLKSAKLRTIL